MITRKKDIKLNFKNLKGLVTIYYTLNLSVTLTIIKKKMVINLREDHTFIYMNF